MVNNKIKAFDTYKFLFCYYLNKIKISLQIIFVLNYVRNRIPGYKIVLVRPFHKK